VTEPSAVSTSTAPSVTLRIFAYSNTARLVGRLRSDSIATNPTGETVVLKVFRGPPCVRPIRSICGRPGSLALPSSSETRHRDGRVDGDDIAEGHDVADVRPQPTIPDSLDDSNHV
jgi:hypothetical protein